MKKPDNFLRFFSADQNLYQNDYLYRVPVPILKLLAQFVYRPRKLTTVKRWIVGSTENSLDRYRSFLKRLWEILIIKSNQPLKLTIRWHHQIKLVLFQDSEIARCIYVEGIYEPNEFQFLSNFLKKEMIFVDIGAHTGLYTLFVSKIIDRKGRVFAIEPSYREFKRLKLQLKLNKVQNVRALNIALADRNSTRKLNVAAFPYDGHNSLGSFGYETTKIDHQERVVCKTLDTLTTNAKIGHLDLIKIDVEGAELSVLMGATQTIQKYKPVVLMELSDRTLSKQNAKSEQIWRFLNSLSYIIYEFGENTGHLRKARQKKYYDGENVLAVPKSKRVLFKVLYDRI